MAVAVGAEVRSGDEVRAIGASRLLDGSLRQRRFAVRRHRHRIHGELLKLGIEICEREVSRLMPRAPRKPPPQTWRTFLTNHVGTLASIDFFTVPTAAVRVFYVFVVLAHDRRCVLHFNVTGHPTATWTAQQIVEAFPEANAPKYLMRDRDRIYGGPFRDRLAGMGIEEVLSAPRSPWQNPFVERLIGSVRRECLDHMIVLGERHLRRILASYFTYYHRSRTHLSISKDAPSSRAVMSPETGEVKEMDPFAGGEDLPAAPTVPAAAIRTSSPSAALSANGLNVRVAAV